MGDFSSFVQLQVYSHTLWLPDSMLQKKKKNKNFLSEKQSAWAWAWGKIYSLLLEEIIFFSSNGMEVKSLTKGYKQGCNHTLYCQKAELLVLLALQDIPHVQCLQKLFCSGFLTVWGEKEWCYISHSFRSPDSYMHLESWSLDAIAMFTFCAVVWRQVLSKFCFCDCCILLIQRDSEGSTWL